MEKPCPQCDRPRSRRPSGKLNATCGNHGASQPGFGAGRPGYTGGRPGGALGSGEMTAADMIRIGRAKQDGSG